MLLLDPVRNRREEAALALKAHFDVVEAGTPADAVASIKLQKPDAIVATLRQVESNGLIVARGLRQEVGRDAFIVVHGPTTTFHASAERNPISRHHGVDRWTPNVLEPIEMDTLVGAELNARRRNKQGRPSLFTRARRYRWRDLVSYFTRLHHVIPTPPPREDGKPGWIEILNGPPTVSNVRRLMAKTIF